LTQDERYYREVYLNEVREHIKSLNDLVMHLEKNPSDKGAIIEAFRAMHSIKGDSAIMGLKKIADTAHEAEDLLSALRDGKEDCTTGVIDRMLGYVDAIEAMVEAFAGGGSKASDKEPGGDDRGRAEADGNKDTAGATGGAGAAPPGENAEGGRFGAHPPSDAASAAGAAKCHCRPAPLQSGGRIGYRVDMRLDFEPALKTMRIFSLMKVLAENGDLISTDPPNDQLVGGDFGDKVSAVIITQDIAKLKESLAQLAGIQAVDVQEIEVNQVGGADGDKVVGALSAGDRASKIEKLLCTMEDTIGEETAATMIEDKVRGRHKLEGIKVNISSLDKLFNLAGEMVLAKSRLNNIVKTHEINELKEIQRFMDGVVTDLQSEVMTIRLMPIDQVLGVFPRMVRDMAKAAGKDIDLIIEGGNTAVDRKILEEIMDPVVHIIRNSVDHGIETPEARAAVGKGPVGTIKVNAKRDAGHFILEIEDDGQGIDPRVVRDTAVERGLINRKKAESMSDEEAMMLICIPGFSTKRQVSEVSGRGVGMSAVKSKIEALGGTITISSQVGTGTRVAMRLPASMATMKILVVEVKDHAYAIPISDVLAIEEVSSKDLRYVQGEPFIVIRNQVMRAYRLAALLGIEDEEKGSYMAIIVKRADGATYGLLVTRVIDEDEVAMKPVPRIIRGVRGLLGSSILGDGKPTFILDVMTLV